MKVVYRVVSAVLAALVVPALYFLDLIHYIVDVKIADGYLDDTVSLQTFVEKYGDKLFGPDRKPFGAHLIETLQPLKPSAITTAVFVAVMLLMVLAIIICSAFTNARKVNLIFAVVGLAATIGAMAAFNHMTSYIINGPVTIGNIVNAILKDSTSLLAGIGALFGVGSMTGYIGDLLLLRLGSAFTASVILFIAIIFWTVAFLLVDLDPEAGDKAKVKKLNKAKKN